MSTRAVEVLVKTRPVRGAAVDAINITVAESQGSAPNVALYLDEQPVTAGYRPRCVHQRYGANEVSRPQGTPGQFNGGNGATHYCKASARPVRCFFCSWSSTSGGEDAPACVVLAYYRRKYVRVAPYNDRQWLHRRRGLFQADNTSPVLLGDGHLLREALFANGTVLSWRPDGSCYQSGR